MRPALPALLLGAMLVTAGCSGVLGPSQPPSDQRALDAMNRSRTAVTDVTSYRFTMDGRAEATGNDGRTTVDLAGHGVVDVSRRRLNATTRARDSARSVYVTNYTAYTECTRMGWERENLTRSTPWLDYTPLGQQLALLERANVYWRGTEPVDGTEAAVVVAYPTEADLRSVADARGTGASGFEGGNVRNVTVTAWLDAETGLPLRTRYEIRVERGGATATAGMTFRFTGYDEPTTVARPAFDADAVWDLGCPGS